MLFVSTRGQTDMSSSAHVIKEGLAKDGGLFVPQKFPLLHMDDILALQSLTYPQAAAKILAYFLTDFTQEELADCTEKAYTPAKFGKDPVPLAKVGEITDTLELWHGPTSAFKDIALQLLPRLLTKALVKTGENTKVIILVATSGDTGKAALDGFADVENTEIMVFYPSEGVSPMQKLQMTTQKGENVHVYGLEGNFDDAQTGVKAIFNDVELRSQLKETGFTLSSANSINWGRLVPQIVYYFKAYAAAVARGRVEAGKAINFAVPTGNFGDILAGYYAKKMGLPVKKFICASNANNVLTEFINTGTYDKQRAFHKTVSPSMDILVSSNLERLLYDITGNDPALVATWMEQLNTEGFYSVGEETAEKIREHFFGAWVDEVETSETIGRVYNDFHYLMDPHTAVAWRACEKYRLLTSDTTYTIVLSTASPYKFNKVVLDSLGKGEGFDNEHPFVAMKALAALTEVPVPQQLADLEQQEELHKAVIPVEQMLPVIQKIYHL